MTVKQSRAEMMTFLVDRRFPSARAIRASWSSGVRNSIDGDDCNRVLTEAKEFQASLAALPDDKLAARVEAVRKEDGRLARAKAEEEENARFFNQPFARADNQFWAKAAFWSIDEALALSLGRDPSRVNWKNVEPFVWQSAFAAEYSRQRLLLIRAVAMKQLSDGTLPGAFLAWAKRNRFPYPQELEDAVAEHGHQVADWKTMYDDLAERLKRSREDSAQRVTEALHLADEWQNLADSQAKRNGELAAAHTAQVDRLAHAAKKLAAERDAAAGERDALKAERVMMVKERESLAALVEQVQAQLDSATASEKPLHPGIRRSLDKMILGMAMDKFNFKPGAQKNPATKNIADALLRQGIKLDVDTVRARLQEAVQAEALETDKTEKSA